MAFNIFNSNDNTKELEKAKQEIAILQERITAKDKALAELRQENKMFRSMGIEPSYRKEDIEKYKKQIQNQEARYKELLIAYKELLNDYNSLKEKPVQKPVVRPSRRTKENLELIRKFKAKGMSYAQIARAMEEATGENWAKSTIHMFLNK